MAAGEMPTTMQRRPARRGMYVLPSLFTAGNIAAGYYAITESIRGSLGDPKAFNRAALAIAFAAMFDGIDGRVARMTHTASDFGREFDSLADVIAFGVAPSLLAYLWGVHAVLPSAYPQVQAKLHDLGAGICFLFLVSGACRLARFNISTNPQPRNPGTPGKKYFVGMPIPAGAGVIAAVVHFELGSPVYGMWMSALWLALVAAVSFLMVSNWRFWSAKELNLSERQPVRSVLILVALLTLIIWLSQYTLLIVAMAYLVSGVLARMAYSAKRSQAAPSGGSQL